jgi:hypothetical protein
MIFRAVFWIGLVALLMPREPDLGFGRPDSVGAPVGSEIAQWAATNVKPELSDPKSLCRYNADACSAGLSVLDGVRSAAVKSLSAVKADIEQNGRAHTHGTTGG